MENVKVGVGIYAANKDEQYLLPTFYYPVFVNDDLQYVYQVYDDGTGTYQSTFSKTYAKEDAGLWVEDNGNALLLTKSGTTKISSIPLAEEPKYDHQLSDYTNNKEHSLQSVDITKSYLEVNENQTNFMTWIILLIVLVFGIGVVIFYKRKHAHN